MLAQRARPSFSMCPVTDLRSGLPGALAVDAAFDDATLAVGLRDAFDLARGARFAGPLQISVRVCDRDDTVALRLLAALEHVGRPARALDVALEESDLTALGYSAAMAVADACRACGFGVVLHAAETAFVPFGARARASFTELRIREDHASRQQTRVDAAREAGVMITATSPAHDARTLIRNGFDRAL